MPAPRKPAQRAYNRAATKFTFRIGAQRLDGLGDDSYSGYQEYLVRMSSTTSILLESPNDGQLVAMDSQPSASERLLSPRWTRASLAALIVTLSGWVLVLTSIRIYYEYYFLPLTKAQEGYLYPEWRYRIFDVFLIAWCIDGILASALLFQGVILHRSITVWTRRTTFLFFALLAFLVLSAVFGMYLLSIGK
jgi:hypothetical protein